MIRNEMFGKKTHLDFASLPLLFNSSTSILTPAQMYIIVSLKKEQQDWEVWEFRKVLIDWWNS